MVRDIVDKVLWHVGYHCLRWYGRLYGLHFTSLRILEDEILTTLSTVSFEAE